MKRQAEGRRQAGMDIRDFVKKQYLEGNKGASFLNLLSSRTDDLKSYVTTAREQILNLCLVAGTLSTKCHEAFSDLHAAMSSLTIAVATLSEELGIEYKPPEVSAKKGNEAGQKAAELLGRQPTTEEEAVHIELRGVWNWVGTVLLIAVAGVGRGVWETSKAKAEEGKVTEHDEKRKKVDQHGNTHSTGAEKTDNGATPSTTPAQGTDRHNASGLVCRSPAANAETKVSPPAPMKHFIGGPPPPDAGAPSALLFGATPAKTGVTGAVPFQPSPPVLLNSNRNGSSPSGPPNSFGSSITSTEKLVAAETAKGESTDFSDELCNPFLQRWS
ncbi:hypothetical protein TraAM80_07411 [Trypanosoma rangeli]|uniref:Uncharacterized protein n=1 Tax=Trypanosoma rangeli TaxID=5698 RepID=A0A3R7LP96_TRYRA|nr:uncharacterized protein TraAM80_07411 [Trypanosoma rangeli]RNF00786.1 hypothetical protein TraAM80_07411 [Trypanosoma rangeli]|eukprot:RNF00786.1 hypothetical protein TraAM80_07411 [Trypanosoma rangeli]